MGAACGGFRIPAVHNTHHGGTEATENPEIKGCQAAHPGSRAVSAFE
jgi:hypothetical protein